MKRKRINLSNKHLQELAELTPPVDDRQLDLGSLVREPDENMFLDFLLSRLASD